MKGQQAPTSGRSGDGRQASRSKPVQVASTIRKSIRGGTHQKSSSAINMVINVLPTLENRRSLSQASGPTVASGGETAAAGAART